MDKSDLRYEPFHCNSLILHKFRMSVSRIVQQLIKARLLKRGSSVSARVIAKWQFDT